MDMSRSFITRAGEGLTFNTTPTDHMTFLCKGDENMPDVMIERLSPCDGPPLHSHPWAGWEVVIKGRVRFHIDGEEHDLGPGDFIYTPADAVHSFMAIGDEDAEIVQFQWPGGFHIAYAQIAAAFEGGAPDPAELERVAAANRFTLHGPPMAVMAGGGH